MRGEKAELILIPCPAVGHLVSAGEFAKHILAHSKRFSTVTVLLIKPPNIASQIDAYKASLTASEPRVTCIDLPPAPPPPLDLLHKSLENFITLYIEAHAPHVRDAVRGRTPAAFVLDFFCESFADIANDLRVPSYIYLTTGAAFLSLMLHLPNRPVSTEFTLSGQDVVMPGFCNPVPPHVLPEAVHNSEGGYTSYLKIAKRFRACKGIIVNTIPEMESYALSAFAEDKTIPPIYPVGPVIDLKGEGQNKMGDTVVSIQRIKILNWLDQQPAKSVVFLCFGSAGEFRAPQIKEIATGLERSGHRFLWSIREPAGGNTGVGEILPQGFAERTRETGLVCSWVPQVEILAHMAIGGFVSHCGWNSTLESMWNGVPMVTWPMYAEQQINAFMMVKELGVAVELRMDYRKDADEVVAAAEVEAAVREVMKSKSKVRERVEKLKEISRSTLLKGGASYNMFGQLVENMLGDDI